MSLRTFRGISQSTRNSRHRIANTFSDPRESIAGCVGHAFEAFAYGVGRGAEGVTFNRY